MSMLKQKLSKKELIAKLNKELYIEANAIVVYSKHVKTILDFSDITMANRKKIRECLDLLINDSENHKKILVKISNKVEEMKTNVY